jgi:ADP-ribosyl-[dinitrogen reductase] hydrolase
MTGPNLGERLAGGVWGHLVGDAMGVPYEFSVPGSINGVEWGHIGTHHQPPGTWSDDGALMLALLDSLLTTGFDLEDQSQRYVAWLREGAYTPDGLFDIGPTTRSALERVEAGTPAAAAGGTDEYSNGNGSLMRVLPVALVGRAETDDVLVSRASAASAVTHAHPRCRVTCAVCTLLARNLLLGESDRGAAMDKALVAVKTHMPPEWRQDFDILAAWEPRTGDGYVIDCFWSAWDAFSGAASYPEAIERAVGFGKDTDTTACVAGGLAGIYWGVEDIPDAWRTQMRGQQIVKRVLAELISRGVA